MSQPADVVPIRQPELGAEPTEYLGPAVVTELEGTFVRVAIPEGESALAEMALAFPYRPVVGDVLLVIGRGGKHWVIGVLSGAGRSTIEVQGDVELRAVDGELALSGDRGVVIRGRSLDVTVEKVEVLAERIVERCATLYQRARELFSVHAKEKLEIVEGQATTQAEGVTIVTEQKVLINGKHIHLG